MELPTEGGGVDTSTDNPIAGGNVTVTVNFKEKVQFFFTDVVEGSYCETAVLWAVENGHNWYKR